MNSFRPYLGELVLLRGFFYEILRVEINQRELRLVGYSDELNREVDLSVMDVASRVVESAAA